MNSQTDEVTAHAISHLQVASFRRLVDFQCELRPFNVFIGSNGVGKTSLLDVVDLLAAAANGKLENWLSAHGGFHSCRTSGASNVMRFAVRMPSTTPRDSSYAMHLVSAGYGWYVIDAETLTVCTQEGESVDLITSLETEVNYLDLRTRQSMRLSKGNDVVREGSTPDYARSDRGVLRPGETALHQAPDGLPILGNIRSVLGSVAHYHLLDLSPTAPVRQPQMLRPALSPGINGEDLNSCLFTLKENFPDQYNGIEQVLRAGFPEFERFEFPPLSQGVIGMAWKDRRDPRALFMNQLSDGMLRFLWLVTALNTPRPAAITLVDEPEVSLHPQLLSILSEVMREASRRTQLLVATHSDRFVGFLKPTEVLTMEADGNGATTARWGETFDVDEWLEDYTLGEIWRMGLMRKEHP